MEIKKHIKIKIVFGIIFLILDFLFLPFVAESILTFFSNPKGGLMFAESGVIGSILNLTSNKEVLKLFLFFQIPVLGMFIHFAWDTSTLKKRNKIQNGIGGPSESGDGEFGTSRWQTEKERDEKNDVWLSNKPLKRGGIILGVEKKKTHEKFWVNTKDIHTLLIANTRFGKGRRIILPSIWEVANVEGEGESIVVTDPKGENFIITSEYLKNKGYEVVVINLREPLLGNSWNMMEGVNQAIKNGDDFKAFEIASNIASSIMSSKKQVSTSDPVWELGAKGVIAGLILYVSKEAPEGEKHMASVYNVLAKYGGIFSEFVGKLPTGHISKLAFASSEIAPDKMQTSFLSMVLANLQVFIDPSIAKMTSKTDHNLKDSGRKKVATYLIIPDDKPARDVIATLYIDSLYQELTELANEKGGKCPVRINFFLDEFGNLPTIPTMESKITIGAGRGMRFTLVVQNINQIKDKYKDGANVIKGNCSSWIFFGTNDIQGTAKELSEKTGKYTIENVNYSSSFQDRGASKTSGLSLTGRSLLTPDEIERWDNNYSLVFVSGNYPVLFPLLDLSKLEANSDFGLTKPTGDIFSDERSNNSIIEYRWGKYREVNKEKLNDLKCNLFLPDPDFIPDNLDSNKTYEKQSLDDYENEEVEEDSEIL